MIRETYKGRQLKAVKGKSYGKSRISVNGTECGEWLGTQTDVIEWAKRTIDDVDSRPYEGRWAEGWYEPGTYELNEIGHVVAPGGTCSCNLCMKPYLADSAEKTAPEVTWTDKTDRRGRPYDAEHVQIVDQGLSMTALYIPDPEQAKGPEYVLEHITEQRYEGVEIVAEATRHFKNEGAVFSGWIVRSGSSYGEPIANKGEALKSLRREITDYFTR